MTLIRSVEPFRMQAPELSEAEQRLALSGFARLNRLSRITTVIYSELVRHACLVAGRPLRVLDIASGGGDLALAWALMAKRDRLAMQITTLDGNEIAIETQQTASRKLGVELGSLKRDCLSEPLPSGFDVVTCTQFVHRLDDQHVIRLLQSMQASASRAVVVCDWKRSRLNLSLMQIASRVVSRSTVVHHDISSSIRGAYTRNEFIQLAESALFRPVRSRHLLTSHFVLTIEDSVEFVASPAFA